MDTIKYKDAYVSKERCGGMREKRAKRREINAPSRIRRFVFSVD